MSDHVYLLMYKMKQEELIRRAEAERLAAEMKRATRDRRAAPTHLPTPAATSVLARARLWRRRLPHWRKPVGPDTGQSAKSRKL